MPYDENGRPLHVDLENPTLVRAFDIFKPVCEEYAQRTIDKKRFQIKKAKAVAAFKAEVKKKKNENVNPGAPAPKRQKKHSTVKQPALAIGATTEANPSTTPVKECTPNHLRKMLEPSPPPPPPRCTSDGTKKTKRFPPLPRSFLSDWIEFHH